MNWHNAVWLFLSCMLLVQGCSASEAKPHLAPSPVSAPRSLASAARLDAYLRHLGMRGAVLVAQNGAVFKQGYGLADSDAHILNTSHTRFRIGSLTKQFTALAILLLQDQGKLHVQDLICIYISSCPQAWRPITIHQLLIHTSGIPSYTGLPNFVATMGQPVTVEQLIARFKNQPLLFPAGKEFRYSNSGYILLGFIIEKVTDMSYATFLQKNIFVPLHMHETSYDDNHPQLPGHATGYYHDNAKAEFVDMSVPYAAGALASTVEDLYLWDQGLTHHQLLSQAAFNALFTPHISCADDCSLPTDLGYGYGWYIAKEPAGQLNYHTGAIDGYISYNGFYPNRDVDIVVLSNLEATNVLKIGRDLASIVFGTHT
ncbi:MAG TPA: serine hydrolase domain-containing protein [Ktedonosporobacter sp.]|nr:serine hydrolase domain-containing protein [Ktedonosporobacter sp.]